MSIAHIDDVRRSLEARVPFLKPLHADILSGLLADGVIRSDDAVHAAAARNDFAARIESMHASRYNEKALRLALGHCRRLGLEPDESGRVSMTELNRVLASKGLTPENRVRLKTELFHAGMID